MNRLIVVRHGNTFAPGQALRRIGATTDLPLVATGHEQAAALAHALPRLATGRALVFAGPLQRHCATARPIAAAFGAEIAVQNWLNEIDHGPDEGQFEALVDARVGRAALDAWESSGVPPPGWHVDPVEAVARWRALLHRPPAAQTLVVVTSGGLARFARLAVETDAHGPIKLRTGAYGIIDHHPDGWQVTCWDVRPL